MTHVAASPLSSFKIRVRCFFAGLLSLFLLAISGTPARADDPFAQLSGEALKVAPAATIAPSGRYVTLQDPSGMVWLINPVSGAKRPLTTVKTGTPAIAWARDGRLLVVADSHSASAYRVPSGKATAHWKGSGLNASPRISPDGKYLSFLREHNLWVASIDGRQQHALTIGGGGNTLAGDVDPLYAREFHVETHSWWAPDSSSIAYIETAFQDEDHYPVAGALLPSFRLKVIDVRSGAARTIAESSGEWPYLLRVAWHPDGRHIIAYRMNRLQTVAELVLFETGSATSNQERIILREQDAYWINAPETPVFVRDGRQIAVTSERSGNRHVYLYDIDGSPVRDLTPGDFEVYRLHKAVDPSGGVFISASTGDKQQQNLYRVDLQTGETSRITSEAGWHETALDSSGDAYVDTYSSANLPPSVHWNGAKNTPVELAVADHLKAVANTSLTIKMHDGTSLLARLFTPEGFDVRKLYPVILYTSSGPEGRVAQDSWSGWQMAWNRQMVRNGYLVLAVDTRGSAGYGHLFEESLHHRFGAQETSDLREVISYLNQQAYVDVQRLGIWGCDYGAHTAVHAMMEIPYGFKAGFADSPILDWDDYDAYFTERYLAMPKSHIADYDDSSPLDSARRMTGELLIASSPDNLIVRSSQQSALDETLAKSKNRKIVKQIHRTSISDPYYRSSQQQLAKLLSSVTKFFQAYL